MAQIAKWIVLGALFIIPFLPLYVADTLFFPFITGKGFAFRILIEAALAAFVVLAFISKEYRPRFSWPLALYGAFVLWMLVADLLAINSHKALWSNFERMDGWVTLIHLLAFGVIAGTVLTARKLWDKWWLTFLGASALVTGYGLLQIVGALATHQGGRIDATFGNAAYLPAYLLFCIAIALWQALSRTGALRYALLVLAALEALIVFFSATRGAFLGLIGAVVVGGILWLIESKGAGKRIAIGALVAVVVLVGGLFLARTSTLVTESQTLSRLASSFSIESLETRFSIWGIALKGAAERPLTGWGQEGFNYVFAKHYDTSLFAQEAWFDRAHNVFLDWLIAGGVPALLLFLGSLVMLVVSLYKGPFSRTERVLILSALVAYAIQGLAVFDNLFTYVPLVALIAFVHGRAATPIASLENASTVHSSGKTSALGGVALAGAVALIFTVNVPGIQAGTELIKGLGSQQSVAESTAYLKQSLARESFASQEIREYLALYAAQTVVRTDVSDADKSAVLTLAISEMSKEIDRAPADPRLRLEAASTFAAAGYFTESLAQLDAALALSPKKQTTLLQKGSTQWQAGDFAGARATFDEAYALDRSFTELAAFAAGGAIMVGDTPAGEALLIEAFGTTTVDRDPVRIAYFQTKQYQKLVNIEQLRVRMSGNSAEARYNLARLYAGLGRTAEAIAEIRATIAAFPDTASTGAQLLAAFGVK